MTQRNRKGHGRHSLRINANRGSAWVGNASSAEAYVPEIARTAAAELEEVDDDISRHTGHKQDSEPDLKERVRLHLAAAGIILD